MGSSVPCAMKMGVRFVFPHAPVMPVTINNGYEMRAWFDIVSLTLDGQIDTLGIAKSIGMVEKLIEREVAQGVSTNNIVLAGFSQGALIALATGLSYLEPLAGIIALSGYLPLETFTNASEANKNTPIFIAHGTEDPIVPYALGKATYVALQQANYPTEWHSYRMPHSVCEDEINDISKWMLKIFRE